MSFFKKHKKGIFGTLIFHFAVLLMLLFLGFFTPLPLPGEEGILVDFGDSEQGLGDEEPRPRQAEPARQEPVQQEEQEATTPPPPPPATPVPEPQPEEAQQEAMTQDYEETAAIDAAERRKREEEERQQRMEEERRRQDELAERRRREEERQRQEELERQREAELERQRQAELERQRREEAERKRREEEQRKINEINNKAQNAFEGNNQGTQGQGTSDNQGEGRRFPGGNQGDPAGDSDAARYGPGGSGSGSQGHGISYSLAGRSPRGDLPKPVHPGNDEGLVVVKVTVDKNGNVTSAQPGERGTNIMNKRFWDAAKSAALKAKFNVDPDAPAFQQGTISYRFSLD